MLTTLNRAKPFLGIPLEVVEHDMTLELALSASSVAIERECNRELGMKVSKQIIDGSGTKFLRLRNFPIHSVSMLKDKGTIVGLDEFSIEAESGMLFRRSGWTHGARTIEVEYLSGYILPNDTEDATEATLPRNYELACILYAQTLMQTPGVSSERVGDISVNYTALASGDLPAAVAALIRL